MVKSKTFGRDIQSSPKKELASLLNYSTWSKHSTAQMPLLSRSTPSCPWSAPIANLPEPMASLRPTIVCMGFTSPFVIFRLSEQLQRWRPKWYKGTICDTMPAYHVDMIGLLVDDFKRNLGSLSPSPSANFKPFPNYEGYISTSFLSLSLLSKMFRSVDPC